MTEAEKREKVALALAIKKEVESRALQIVHREARALRRFSFRARFFCKVQICVGVSDPHNLIKQLKPLNFQHNFSQ